jgi:hypothetical protein
MIVRDLKIPENPQKPIIQLGVGEPSKANGYDLPPIITEAMVEVV